MALPTNPPYPPMKALLVNKIPTGKEWRYEPKWDGFRCLAFKDDNQIQLQSKNGQPLSRYFPELVLALQEIKGKKFVLDGEIVIPSDGTFSFDDLLQRIHPAESRVRTYGNDGKEAFCPVRTHRNRKIFDSPAFSQTCSISGLPSRELPSG